MSLFPTHCRKYDWRFSHPHVFKCRFYLQSKGYTISFTEVRPIEDGWRHTHTRWIRNTKNSPLGRFHLASSDLRWRGKKQQQQQRLRLTSTSTSWGVQSVTSATFMLHLCGRRAWREANHKHVAKVNQPSHVLVSDAQMHTHTDATWINHACPHCVRGDVTVLLGQVAYSQQHDGTTPLIFHAKRYLAVTFFLHVLVIPCIRDVFAAAVFRGWAAF